MKNSINVCRHRFHSTFNLLKLSSNNIFLSLENKKPHSWEICSGLLWMLMIFPKNCKINFRIFKMIRPHVIFFRKWHFLSSGVLYANPTHKYPNWRLEYYFHFTQHTSARAAFQLLYMSKQKHKIKEKLKMI